MRVAIIVAVCLLSSSLCHARTVESSRKLLASVDFIPGHAATAHDHVADMETPKHTEVHENRVEKEAGTTTSIRGFLTSICLSLCKLWHSRQTLWATQAAAGTGTPTSIRQYLTSLCISLCKLWHSRGATWLPSLEGFRLEGSSFVGFLIGALGASRKALYVPMCIVAGLVLTAIGMILDMLCVSFIAKKFEIDIKRKGKIALLIVFGTLGVACTGLFAFWLYSAPAWVPIVLAVALVGALIICSKTQKAKVFTEKTIEMMYLIFAPNLLAWKWGLSLIGKGSVINDPYAHVA